MCFLEAGWAKASWDGSLGFCNHLTQPPGAHLSLAVVFSWDTWNVLQGQLLSELFVRSIPCSDRVSVLSQGSVFVHNQRMSVLAQAGLTAQQAPAFSRDAEQSHLWLGDTVTVIFKC